MQSGNNQRVGNSRKYQNFRVEDLRHKLNRMREQRATEGGGNEPPPDPGYNYLRDPSREYETNYHRPNYRGRGRGGKYHQPVHESGYGHSKESAAFRKEFNQGRTVNIKVEVETETGNRTCSVEMINRGRARGGFRGRFNHNVGYEDNQHPDAARGRRGRGGGRSRGFFRGRFRGRNNRGGYGTRRGGGVPIANQSQSLDEYWDDDENDNKSEHGNVEESHGDQEYYEEHGEYEEESEDASKLRTKETVINDANEDAQSDDDGSKIDGKHENLSECEDAAKETDDTNRINKSTEGKTDVTREKKDAARVKEGTLKSEEAAINKSTVITNVQKEKENALKSDSKDSKISDKPVVVKVEKKVSTKAM